MHGGGLEVNLENCDRYDRYNFSGDGLDNHRMVEVGSDLWRSSCPALLLKQGHLEQVAHDHVQMAFEYLQRWRLHNLSEQPVPVLGHPHHPLGPAL